MDSEGEKLPEGFNLSVLTWADVARIDELLAGIGDYGQVRLKDSRRP